MMPSSVTGSNSVAIGGSKTATKNKNKKKRMLNPNLNNTQNNLPGINDNLNTNMSDSAQRSGANPPRGVNQAKKKRRGSQRSISGSSQDQIFQQDGSYNSSNQNFCSFEGPTFPNSEVPNKKRKLLGQRGGKPAGMMGGSYRNYDRGYNRNSYHAAVSIQRAAFLSQMAPPQMYQPGTFPSSGTNQNVQQYQNNNNNMNNFYSNSYPNVSSGAGNSGLYNQQKFNVPSTFNKPKSFAVSNKRPSKSPDNRRGPSTPVSYAKVNDKQMGTVDDYLKLFKSAQCSINLASVIEETNENKEIKEIKDARIKAPIVTKHSDVNKVTNLNEAIYDKIVNRPKGRPFFKINPEYHQEKFRTSFSSVWKNESSNSTSDDGITILNEPFKCAYLPKFIANHEMLDNVVTELDSLKLLLKNNDMYKFKQTNDLKDSNLSHISLLRSFFNNFVKKFLRKCTGVSINNDVSMSYSRYDFSDVLLCHNDGLEFRKFAYVLYLVPPWNQEDGGTLDLFTVDDQSRPASVVKQLIPEYNSFVFFEVSPQSYHQVSEVLTRNKSRLSINGWFHVSDKTPFPTKFKESPWIFSSPGHVELDLVYEWINPQYLNETVQTKIKAEFESNSEILLEQFVVAWKYEQLAEALQNPELMWRWQGPPSRKHYEVMDKLEIPGIVNEFMELMKSEAVFLILSQLTGLELHSLSSDQTGAMKVEEQDQSESIASIQLPDDDDDEEDNSEVRFKNSKLQNTGRDKNKSYETKEKNLSKEELIRFDEILDDAQDCRNYMNEDWLGLPEQIDQIKENTKEARCVSQLRQWKSGCYSMIQDDDLSVRQSYTLDAQFFCNGSDEWAVGYGGCSTYIADGEDKELLTVTPHPNCLALVYRDKATMKFTKYINIKSKLLEPRHSMFQEILTEYREADK